MRTGVALVLLIYMIVPAQATEVVSRPEIGVEATVGPGDVLYTETRFSRAEFEREVGMRATLQADMLVTRKGEVLPKGTALKYYPPPPFGSIPPAGSLPKLPMYCSERHTVLAGTGAVLLGAPGWKGYLCLQDSKQNGRFDTIVQRGHRLPDRIVSTPYTVSKDTVKEVLESKPFTMEILYQGAGGGVLRLSYREYMENVARPAFQQDATFDLEKGEATRLLFKGAEIEVFEAGNRGIRYRILSPFK